MVDIFLNYYDYFLAGARTTVLISLITVFFGFILGCLISFMKLSKNKLLHGFAGIYITVIRGTPLLVQLYIVYFQLDFIPFPETTVLGVALDRALPCAIALSINSSAYVAEVIRSGIQAVDEGQMEAARSIGFKYGESMRLVILPQAIRNILPALGNEFVTVIKESSIVSVIGISDLMYSTNGVIAITYRSLPCLAIAACLYFILTFTGSRLIAVLEKRMKHGRE